MSLVNDNPGGRLPGLIYKFALGFALFSGFGQMPILKRYYFSDLPLMGWTQSFYVLSDIHYIAAALILMLMAWRIFGGGEILSRSWSWGPRSNWTYILLAVLIISGGLKVLRNAGLYLPPPLLVIADFSHLGSAIATLITLIAGLFRKKTRQAAKAV
jgi:phosphoglycerol transferase MdoB-like AlkP superfamily enzyme